MLCWTTAVGCVAVLWSAECGCESLLGVVWVVKDSLKGSFGGVKGLCLNTFIPAVSSCDPMPRTPHSPWPEGRSPNPCSASRRAPAVLLSKGARVHAGVCRGLCSVSSGFEGLLGVVRVLRGLLEGVFGRGSAHEGVWLVTDSLKGTSEGVMGLSLHSRFNAASPCDPDSRTPLGGGILKALMSHMEVAGWCLAAHGSGLSTQLPLGLLVGKQEECGRTVVGMKHCETCAGFYARSYRVR